MSIKKIMTLFLSVISYFYSIYCFADSNREENYKHRFYVAITGGYGSTTWGQLVPENESAAMSLSTPTSVSEGGAMWGIGGGYEFIPEFALEGTYLQFPSARLYFDPMSLFSFNYDRTELTSHIETISLMAKIMIFIPHTSIRAFSSVGPTLEHRYDAIKDIWHVSPAFGAGFNYNISKDWMVEIGTNYVAGYGKAEIDPSENYVPFLYSVFARLAYRFG